MWSIFRHELKHRRTGLIAYSLSALLLVILYVSIFPSIRDSAAQLEKLVEAYPKGVIEAFGIQDFSFNTIEKYLGAEHFSIVWPVMAIALLLTRAGGSIAGEIEQGTMGLLLALPVRRTTILLAKYWAGVTAIAIFAAVSVLSVIPVAAIAGITFNPGADIRSWLLSMLFMWAVFAFAFALSTVFSERNKVYITTSGALVIMYIMNVVAGLQKDLDWLKYGSVFHYFNIQDVLRGAPISSSSLGVFAGTIIIAALFGWWRFNRRDITV